MKTATIRYIVRDVAAAIDFYSKQLGFHVDLHPAPGFAMLSRDPLRLLLSAPGAGGGGHPLPDGRLPEPGGWNRMVLTVEDLAGEIDRLQKVGVHFRSEVVVGVGGRQILIEDPSGNAVELFEPGAG